MNVEVGQERRYAGAGAQGGLSMRNFDKIPVDLIEKQFLAFLYSRHEGLCPRKDLDQLKLDTKTRYQTKGDKGSETSAVYCVYTDGWPAGYVRSFRTDDYCEWKFDMTELRGIPSQKKLYDNVTSSEFKEYARQVQEDRRIRARRQGSSLSYPPENIRFIYRM